MLRISDGAAPEQLSAEGAPVDAICAASVASRSSAPELPHWRQMHRYLSMELGCELRRDGADRTGLRTVSVDISRSEDGLSRYLPV